MTGGRIDGSCESSQYRAGGPPDQSQENCLADELGADVDSSGAEGAPQPDLPPTFQYGDDHDVRDTDTSHDEGDGSEGQKETLKGR